jgi:hypothetical protein
MDAEISVQVQNDDALNRDQRICAKVQTDKMKLLRGARFVNSAWNDWLHIKSDSARFNREPYDRDADRHYIHLELC